MGAWDATIFGNDDACDWAYGLEGVADFSLIEQTLQTVLNVGTEYLDVPEAEEALAAAEVVAGLLGRWGVRNVYTETAEAWGKRIQLTPSPDLIQRAVQVVDRIMTAPSELLELWQEADDADFAAWKATVAELKKRLSTGN
jgi:hypothetical protein